MATIPTTQCPHSTAEAPSPPLVQACSECGLQQPVRVCLTCGHVGCCDSTNGHATAHAKSSGHPIIRELPLSARSFTWCYQCNAYLK